MYAIDVSGVISMNNSFLFSKELYSKEALIKAAYDYIDDYYIHLDSDEQNYYVQLEAKDDNPQLSENDFKNTILIHEMRKVVSEKTGKLREIMYARAMASTVIEDNNIEDNDLYNDDNAEDILKDWFDHE